MESILLRSLFKPQPAWPKPHVRQLPSHLPPAIVIDGFDSEAELEDVHKVCDPYGNIRMIHILVEEIPPHCPQAGYEKKRSKAIVYVYYNLYAEANKAMSGLRKVWPDERAVRWDSLFRRH